MGGEPVVVEVEDRTSTLGFESVSELADAARLESLIFLVFAHDAAFAPLALAMERLIDTAAKAEGGGGVAVVLVHPEATGANSGDLRFAWPDESQRWPSAVAARWVRYLHLRVAWHCGGDLDHVDELGAKIRTTPAEDDRALELALNADADERWRRLPSEVLALARIDASSAAARLHALQPTTPFAGRCVAPAGWFARAVLRENPAHSQRAWLRGGLNCQPLVTRVLGRCLELEAWARAELPPPLGPAPEDAVVLFERFHRNSELERRVIPPDPLHLPRDPWEVSSLGSVLVNVSPTGDLAHGLHSLRRLRNVLAHGGGLGWGVFQTLTAIETTLLR
jgi:hypothetical protein